MSGSRFTARWSFAARTAARRRFNDSEQMSTPTPIPPPHFATPEEINRILDRECQRLQAENAKLRENWCDLQWLSSNDVRANFERAYSIYIKGGNTFAGAVRIARTNL